jgi:2-polyprenyl-6-methoxyphenol hydroxylase-like FAD-dependent oxidoreductase
MTRSTMRRALVSGASIAGPALSYWLSRNGWSVTLVERAPQVLGGGYPIDLRGTAVQVVQRMGIYDDVRRQRVGRRSTKVLNQRGRTIATIDFSTLVNDDATGDVELPRGDLTKILYQATRDDVDYVFNESVETMTLHDDRVDVTFASGRSDSFDIAIGADGIHSTTRRLVFGPEEKYIRHLGPIVAIWEEEAADRLPSTGTMYNLPGRIAMHMRENTGSRARVLGIRRRRSGLCRLRRHYVRGSPRARGVRRPPHPPGAAAARRLGAGRRRVL